MTISSIANDLKVLRQLVRPRIKSPDHAQRLSDIYERQSELYDDFRARLLPGRKELVCSVIPKNFKGIWIDFGCGTGWNLESVREQLNPESKVYLVDLCKPLLDVARRRVNSLKIKNVDVCYGDACTWQEIVSQADVVTFSYTLTMIPEWFIAIDNAFTLLKKGGKIAVVDFYVSKKLSPPELSCHHWLSRTLWPLWFSYDDVFLSGDHLNYLRHRFVQIELKESWAKIPYLPIMKSPFYTFIGEKL